MTSPKLTVTIVTMNAAKSYVYAVALHSSGRGAEAMAVLRANLTRHPADRATLLALISFSRDGGDFATALAYAEQLARIVPGEPSIDALITTLRGAIGKSGRE